MISVPFLKAAWLNESVAEAALKLVHSFVEGLRDIIHDRQLPVLHHIFQGD